MKKCRQIIETFLKLAKVALYLLSKKLMNVESTSTGSRPIGGGSNSKPKNLTEAITARLYG